MMTLEEKKETSCPKCKYPKANSMLIKDFFGDYVVENVCPHCGLLWYSKYKDEKENEKDE